MATPNTNLVSQQLPKLNGRNYHFWSIQMRVLFESQDLWTVIDTGVPAIAENQVGLTQEQKDVRKRDKKALFLIFQAVEDVVFERISTASTSKEAWDILQRCYRGEDRVKTIRLQTLRCEFDNLRMKDNEAVEDFYNRVVALVNQMRINGEPLEDRRIVEKILRSLTRRFEYIVVAIEESKDLTTFSLESLLGTLQSHELRMKHFDSSTTTMEQAFATKVEIDDKGKKHVSAFHDKRKVNQRDEDTSKDHEFSDRPMIPLREKKCYYCQQYGHLMKYCWKKKQDEDAHEQGNAKFMEESKDTLFMVYEDAKDCVDEGVFDVVQEENNLHNVFF